MSGASTSPARIAPVWTLSRSNCVQVRCGTRRWQGGGPRMPGMSPAQRLLNSFLHESVQGIFQTFSGLYELCHVPCRRSSHHLLRLQTPRRDLVPLSTHGTQRAQRVRGRVGSVLIRAAIHRQSLTCGAFPRKFTGVRQSFLHQRRPRFRFGM